MKEFLAIFLLAIIVEGIVEWLKTIFKSGKFNLKTFIALLVGIVVCVGTKIDLFFILGVPIFWPYVGSALTGILISRGSNYIHDFVSKIATKST